MENGLKTISGLFDGTKKFVVPYYQRPYAWELDQWKDFIDDLFSHNPQRKYFYGTILLKETAKDNDVDFEVFEIVDGQQRITTLTIFFRILVSFLAELNPKINLNIKKQRYLVYENVHKLKVSEIDNEFFQTYIIKEGETPVTLNTPSQRRLWDAKNYLRGRLQEGAPDEKK